jgi:hypothetical protein
MDKPKRIQGVYIFEDGLDRSPFERCPHCNAELHVVGVHGYNAVDFKAEPSPETLEYDDSWHTEFEEPIDGAVVRCSECNRVIYMTGSYGRAWFYQNLATKAVALLEFFIRKGFISDEAEEEARQIAYHQDVYDKQPAFFPVDDNGVRHGSFEDAESAVAYAATIGLDEVEEDLVGYDFEFNHGDEDA